MKPRFLRLVGAALLAFAVFTLMFRVFGGAELALMPWPVSLIAIAIGVFFLKQGVGAKEESA